MFHRRPTLRETVLLSCLIGFGGMVLACKWESLSILWLTGLLLPSFVVVIHGCINLAYKRWDIGIWHITVRPILILVFYFIITQPLLLVYFDSSPDEFAIGLQIPKGIPLVDARVSNHESSPNTDFELFQNGQPGMYHADIQIHLPKTGNVYLRAYEITRNTPLTKSSLKENTLRYFLASSEEDDADLYAVNFTISEGDWGQPYAARFEVWLNPADKSPDIKLNEKNFIIEGWMR